MSISRVLFRSDGPLTSRRLQNPSPPVIAQMGRAGRRAS